MPLFAAVAEMGRRHQQRRHLAVRPGGRLQANSRQPGDLGQHVLHRVEHCQQALQRRLGLVRVQIGQARQTASRSFRLGLYFIVQEPSG